MPADVFESLPIFQGLNPDQVDQLHNLFVPCKCYGGTVLFEQGELAEHFYLVVEGEAVIRYKPDDGPPIVITRVRRGGLVGWSAVIGRRTYTSGVECAEDSQLLRVHGSDLQSLCERYPDTGALILDRLSDLIAERLQHTHPEVVALLENGIRNGTKCEEVPRG